MKHLVRLMAILICCTLFCAGCIKEPVATTILEFENNSSVSVELVTIHESMTISEPESAKISYEVKGDVPPSIFHVWTYSNVKKVVFDSKVEIDIYNFPPLWEESNYTLVGEQAYLRCFCYTFTDADYQYALEHGTLIE